MVSHQDNLIIRPNSYGYYHIFQKNCTEEFFKNSDETFFAQKITFFGKKYETNIYSLFLKFT